MKIQVLICFLLIVVFNVGCTKVSASEEHEEVSLKEGFHLQKLGASARDLLSDETFTSLTVEVQYMKGYEPNEKALQNLKSFLEKYLHKPKGIDILVKEIAPVEDSTLSLQQIIEIEKDNRTKYVEGKDLAVYILYTNGYHTKESMLGYAYLNTSAVLFGRNIDDNSDKYKKLSRTDLETRVLQHEICHLLGLVNAGSNPQAPHQDEAHGKHCNNKSCLMYYLTDTDDSPIMFLRKGVPKLDKHCLDDLRANGAKSIPNSNYTVNAKYFKAR